MLSFIEYHGNTRFANGPLFWEQLMNWKPAFTRCCVMSFGLALVGCGSAADTASEVASQQSSVPVDATQVTLQLPGMT